MIFSSPEYALVFLPITVLLYYALLRRRLVHLIAPYIFLSSLVYYAWWRWENIWIILASIAFNFVWGRLLAPERAGRKALFAVGVAANLLLLGWFKYTDFMLTNVNALLGADIPLQHTVLPLGISFFTFQQIAWLADIYTRKCRPQHEGFANYCCFVCFFPQLVAGPIVHHQEMMPQFFATENHTVNWENIYHGLVLFSMGLAKKVLLADNLSPIAQYGFDLADSLSVLDALFTSIAYTLQLYFDFSGYSDMAVGAALLFNIKLPWNFNSPYKATNIQDFWRRWHITLSRWLRDYLYIPLGGNRKGSGRTMCNLFVTFLLGGLWHGAAWTFVIWGAMHGLALVLHRLWSQVWQRSMPAWLGWMLTFAFVNFAWIVFRAPNMERLAKFGKAFLGWNGFMFRIPFREGVIRTTDMSSFTQVSIFVLLCFTLALLSPNSTQLYRKNSQKCVYLAVVLALLSIFFMLAPSNNPEFIYSNF